MSSRILFASTLLLASGTWFGVQPLAGQEAKPAAQPKDAPVQDAAAALPARLFGDVRAFLRLQLSY